MVIFKVGVLANGLVAPYVKNQYLFPKNQKTALEHALVILYRELLFF